MGLVLTQINVWYKHCQNKVVVWMPELQLFFKQTVKVTYQIVKDSVIYFMSVCTKTVGAVF